MLHYRFEVFRAVAELQSVSKAAGVLHLSQPAVTRHIHLLEEEVRVPLFVRNGRGMVLTPAGLRFLQHVKETIQAHALVVQNLQGPGGQLHGRLRIGSNKTVLAYHLPGVLARFKERFPGVTCDITDGNTDTIVGALLDQRIDLALIEGPCQRPEVHIQPFYEDEIIWICSPQDPLARMRRPSVATVLSRPLIIREAGAGSRQFVTAALRKLGKSLQDLRIVQEIPHPEAIKRLVAEGLGISFVFRIGVAQELAAGTLVEIKCPTLKLVRPFSLLWPQGPSPSGLGSAFHSVLLEEAAPARQGAS